MLWIILAVIAILVVLVFMFVSGTYNRLIEGRQRVKNSWSQIDVVLHERYDLIPNLVNTVKGYAKHETETLENVMKARSGAFSNSNDAMKFEGELTQAIGRLFAVAEAYPDLKANQSFLELQRTLKEQENKIAKFRQFYNDVVFKYNAIVVRFPSNIVAGMFRFTEEDYLEAPAEARTAPKVEF